VKAFPVVRAARGGVAGRRVQAFVIGLVILASTAASTLALGLLVDSSTPFNHAFAARNGAQVAATIDASRASGAQLAATTRLGEVAAASGPFAEATISGQISFPGVAGSFVLSSVTLAGRASPGGAVDDLTLQQGSWATRPGQVVVSRDLPGPSLAIGQQITVTGLGGSKPVLTVVGIAKSITDTAQGWVAPAEISALHAPGTAAVAQMLYRFRSAGSDAAVNADVAAVRAALPAGALVGTQSYLNFQLQATSAIAPWVPFIVAFGLIGLVMSVLIVVNVVSGAVVAGTRRIGVLKSIGFSPGQVVGSYVLQVALPAVVGCVVGVIIGNLLSVPLLGQTAQVFGVGALGIPPWVDLAVPLGMLALTGVAAVLPALRAGRMSAVQAIATGRAPRPAHGYAAQRLLGRVRVLPRPVTIGLAGPFARPTRTLVTLAAILFGAVSVTFGVGLATSLNRAALDLSHLRTEPVQAQLADGPGGGALPSQAAQESAVVSALDAQPGTLRYVAEADGQISVPGLSRPLSIIAFGGDASWTGYALVSGSWYSGADSVDVNTYFLTATGKSVGDTYTFTSGTGHETIRIAGEVFDPHGSRAEILTAQSTAVGIDPTLAVDQYDVALTPGTSVQAYVNAVSTRLGPDYFVSPPGGGKIFGVVDGLVFVLTLALMVVAGLGVLNTVVLQIRERVHDIGVFKAVGMTPRQTVAMIVCSVAGIGVVAGVIAIPAGIALHNYVVPIMGHGAQTNIPAALLSVYRPWELVLLALSGLVIAAAGALAPAGWAAKTRTASALRAE
jgi:putative ABC transport system permease protein